MHMELTERYFKIVQKASAKANFLHDEYGSWEKAGEVSHDTWYRIAIGSPTNTPRIDTLRGIAFATADQSIPKKYDIRKDLEQLKQTCRRTLRALAKAYGKDRLAEMLRVEPYKLNQWLSARTIYTPEFRYLLAIDSISIDI